MKLTAVLYIVGLVVGSVILTISVSAQDLNKIIDSCVSTGSTSLVAPCQGAILATQAIRGGISATDAMGGEITGSFSTMGRRFGKIPRLSLGADLKISEFDIPNVLESTAAIPGKTNVWVYGIKTTVAAGVLDGFSFSPTIGGILSLDLLGSFDLLLLQEKYGFINNEKLLSLGGRLGLLGESFTMPGITVSLVQHFGEELNWSSIGGDDVQLDTEISTTSLRASIGKDLFVFAFLLGTGLDWQRGDLSILVSDPGVPGEPGIVAGQNLTTRRPVYYMGLSLTRLFFQFSLEAGWIGGFNDLVDYKGEYSPDSTTKFLDLSLRVTI